MAKKILDGLVSLKKNSIRQISIEHEGKKEKQDSEPISPRKIRREKRASSFGLWFIGIVVIVFLFFLFSILFSNAKVLVYPQKITLSLDETISVVKNLDNKDAMQYEVMTVSKDGSKSVKATGEEYIEENASGIITIFNNFDLKDQRLIKNTRFESTSGLIYRIKNSVIVPGIKKVDGKSIPGSVDVKVYADEPGEKYNMNLSDFTIPGFKGDPRFDKFYARSKTPITGGLIGNIKIVSEEDKQTAIKQIHLEIEKEILNEARLQIPSDFMLFDDLINISFESLPNSNVDGNTVLISERVILNGAIINKKELAKFIAKNKIEGYKNEDIEILNINDLEISVVDKNKNISKGEDIELNIKGTATLVWAYNEEQLKLDLVNKDKKDINSVLSKYSGIKKAEVVITPFWKGVFPDKAENIKIERILE
ncbi:hypothetical protein KJ991_01055 [Patescibacteria group bacterium]|nr:hypothetical protein [Patescibacteria group bacterium]MBU4057712.1 hypothetical protein [Patescibacteria group bacterium]MBU4115892.1 hypothetical protein [Patescibacteria group bacterium]